MEYEKICGITYFIYNLNHYFDDLITLFIISIYSYINKIRGTYAALEVSNSFNVFFISLITKYILIRIHVKYYTCRVFDFRNYTCTFFIDIRLISYIKKS